MHSRQMNAPKPKALPRPSKTPKAAPAARPRVNPAKPSAANSDPVDTTYLQTLMGYNARRAALSIIELFLERLAPYGLKPVDFSVMSTIQHNPGVTSRQLCATLNLLPPNLVALIQSLGIAWADRAQTPSARRSGRGPARHAQGARTDGASRADRHRT